MKDLLVLLLAFGLALPLWAQTTPEEVRVATEVENVVVFFEGAEVTRRVTHNFKQGRTTIVFTGLSSKINASSIVTAAAGKVKILSTTYLTNYLQPQKTKASIQLIEDSLAYYGAQIQALNDEKDAFEIEKSMILENKDISTGQQNASGVAELAKAATFFRTRITDINKNISRINAAVGVIEKRTRALKAQKSIADAELLTPTHEVFVSLEAEAATRSEVTLTYIVPDAGWAPKYDIRATSVADPLQIDFLADVYNDSDIDWTDVKLTLSTADPTQSATAPVLTVWNLNYYTPSSLANFSKNRLYEKAEDGFGFGDEEDAWGADEGAGDGFGDWGDDDWDDPEEPVIELAEVAVSELSVNYDITVPYTIPADNQPYLVEVRVVKAPAMYEYLAIPKVDPDAFLVARLVGWEQLNLIPGPASVYYAGTYIGESVINSAAATDTLDLSLGRDKKVQITRTKVRDYTSKRAIGSKRTTELGYEIELKNLNNKDIKVKVLDQFPISGESEIEVEVGNVSGAERDNTTGQLKWMLTLAPSEAKKVAFDFSVKYPKNKEIQLTKQRTMRARYR